MNVLVFTSLYPNNIWPSKGIFIQERMTHFAKLNGCSVKVVAPVPYFPPVALNWRSQYSKVMRREMREGLEVCHPRYFMTPKIGMSLYGLKMYLSALSTIKEIRKNFDFDIIDAHYVYPDGMAAVLLGQYFKRPVVVSARGSDINQYASFPVIRQLLKYTLNNADKVISVCDSLKKQMVEIGVAAEKITVIPNGVDVTKLFPVSREEAKRITGLPADKKVLLSVGELHPKKGFDFLIRALKLLLEEHGRHDLLLVIIGEGASRKALERLTYSLGLQAHVSFTGAIPHKELYYWYNSADLFCLASSREGWPNVIMESLACGTPVVATNVSGIPEIIRSDSLGFLTERKDEEIARTIAIALDKQWDHELIIRYAQEHTWDKVARSVHKVFESVIG